jgi:hypothetical protein
LTKNVADYTSDESTLRADTACGTQDRTGQFVSFPIKTARILLRTVSSGSISNTATFDAS